jgi:hypothetical protein
LLIPNLLLLHPGSLEGIGSSDLSKLHGLVLEDPAVGYGIRGATGTVTWFVFSGSFVKDLRRN